LYRSPNIVIVIKSRRLRWAGHVPRMKEGKPTGKRPLGRSWRRREYSNRIDLKEIQGLGLIRLRMGIIGESL
jgi:hypothetical protein